MHGFTFPYKSLFFLLTGLPIFLLFLIGCASGRYAHVTIQSEPPGARIYKSETLLGNAPVKLNALIDNTGSTSSKSPRKYVLGTFSAYMEGYEATERDITLDIPAGVSPELDGWHYYYEVLLRLNPKNPLPAQTMTSPQPPQQQQQQTIIIPGIGSSSITTRGMVMVTSTPENAEIYSDGAFVGNAPANLKLSEGIHIIEVKKSGYKPYRKEVRVIESSELNLRVTLEKE